MAPFSFSGKPQAPAFYQKPGFFKKPDFSERRFGIKQSSCSMAFGTPSYKNLWLREVPRPRKGRLPESAAKAYNVRFH